MAKGKEIWVCPRCGAQVDISALGLYAEVRCPDCGQEGRVHMQLGNFRLESVLGIGGMSVVYRALDVTLCRQVALKVLNDTFRDRPERVKRFENESAMMARVRHDNVASVYSAGRAYGQFYIAMELVEGENLEHMVSEERPLEPGYALEVVRQAALGLRAASEAGLLHRDMKPGNILITHGDRVKLIDFGLALDASADDTEEVIWATPYYVPPETLQRNPEDVRTDIYALGMTLRYLLSGVEKFDGERDSVTGLLNCKKRRRSFSEQRPDLDPMLCDLADHMTEFLPSRRPKNYDELLEEIEEVRQELTKEAPGESGNPLHKALRWVAPIVTVVCLGCALLGFVSRHFGESEEEFRHQLVATEQMDVTPPGLHRLQSALDLLDAGKYDEAVERLMALSEEEGKTDSCMALWGAYLARTVSELIVLKDDQLRKKVQQRIETLRNGNGVVPPEEEGSMEQLRAHLSDFDLAASDWYSGSGNKAQLTRDQLNEKIEAIADGKLKAPFVFRELQQLAESSLWGRNEDLVDSCLGELEEASADAGIYRPLGRLYNQVMDERLSVRRVAMYEGVRARVLEKIDQQGATKEDVNALVEVAENEKLPRQLRDLVSVENEAATLAMHMQDMMIRKFPEACKKGMSLKRMLFDRYRRPTVICRSEEQQNLAIYAVDGNLSTRWCAKGMDMGGDVLRVKLPEPRSISSVVFYWENSGRQTYRIKAFYRGKEVSSTEVNKNTDSSRVQLAGKTVDELTLTLISTDWCWPSVREIEFYGGQGERLYIPETAPASRVPPEIIEDVGVVVDMLAGEGKPLENLRRIAAVAERGVSNLNTIATSWIRRLDALGQFSQEPLVGNRDLALKELLERVSRCRLVKTKGSGGLAFLNAPHLSPGSQTITDEQQTAFLLRSGVVEPVNEEVAPVYGLKEDRIDEYTLTTGRLQPVPLAVAKRFEEKGSGVIIKTVGDLRGCLKSSQDNPTPQLFSRMPVYNFSKN